MSIRLIGSISSLPFRVLHRAAILFAIFVGSQAFALAQSVGSGVLTGLIASKGTGNALKGATVTLPSLNRSEFTDDSGRYSFSALPPGELEVVVSYLGFTTSTQRVLISDGSAANLKVELESSDTIAMERFTVESVREGRALAINEQRNALNVKNVAAMDEWGVLPTQNVGELISRMPGISFTVDEDNLINNISIRGQPSSFTRINIDGMSATGVGGDGRTATLHSFSASMYEAIEVIYGQLPDKRADSLGGQINLKTRSPLAMTEKRRFTYSLGGRYFPSSGERNVPLSDHPFGVDTSFSYTEVFDVFGGDRNLGISLTASYQQVVNPFDYDVLQYQATTDKNAYFRDYDKRSGLNHRFISGISARVDYRIGRHTTVSARFLLNEGSEPYFHYTFVNPFMSTAASVYDPISNPNGGIMPGYSPSHTEIRPVGNAQMLLTPRRFSFVSKNPTGTLSFEHDYGALQIDHAYRWSNTHWDSGAGRERADGMLSLRTRDPIGFILDNSDLNGRVFTQTAGPSVYDPASYSAFVVTAANATTIPVAQTSTSFVKRDTVTDTNEVSATINASYRFDTPFNLKLKTGLDTVNRRVNNRAVLPRRWYAVPGTVLSAALMPLTEFERQMGGQRLPVYDPSAVNNQLNNTSIWYEDVNYTATQQYTNRRIMEEGVDAAYIQAEAKFGKLTILAGVRGEWVTTDNFTYFRLRTTPIANEPDPFKRVLLDYQKTSTSGDYTKYFPSIHFAYNITANLKARASWSESYSRPPLGTLVPGVTVSDVNQTVTIGNASLRPQMSKNIDLKLEYYSPTNGIFSVGAFRKDITDLFSSGITSGFSVPSVPDNGYDGLYGGYSILTPANIGDAKVQGLEFEVRQRLSFLPGPLKGFTVRANYTHEKTEGKYTGATPLSTRDVANFVPRILNAAIDYNYRKFGVSVDMNYTSDYPQAISVAAPTTGNLYRRKLTTYNAQITYRVLPEATVFFMANNITSDGPELYTYIPNRSRQLLISPMALKMGVTGVF